MQCSSCNIIKVFNDGDDDDDDDVVMSFRHKFSKFSNFTFQ